MKPIYILGLTGLLIFNLNCGGSSTSSNNTDDTGDDDNPSTKAVVTGTVSSGNSNSLVRGLTADQIANLGVFAFDANRNRIDGTIENGTITLALEPNVQYKINFTSGGNFIAELAYFNRAGQSSNYFILTSTGEKNFGTFSFNGDKASCSRNPLSFDDEDGDGVTNFEDPEFNQNYFDENFDYYVDVSIQCDSENSVAFTGTNSPSTPDESNPIVSDNSDSSGDFSNPPVEDNLPVEDNFLECIEADFDNEAFCVDEEGNFFDLDGNPINENDIFGNNFQGLAVEVSSSQSERGNQPQEFGANFNVEECYYVETVSVQADAFGAESSNFGSNGFEEEFENSILGNRPSKIDPALDNLDGEEDGFITLSGIGSDNEELNQLEGSVGPLAESLSFCFDDNGRFINGCEDFILDCSKQCNIDLCDLETETDDSGEEVQVVTLECINEVFGCFDSCLDF